MRSRTLALSFLFALPVALPLAPRLAADEPTTYQFPAKETWKVGDTVTKTSKESMTLSIKGPDGSALQEGGEATEYAGVLRVLEVNAEGDYTKAVVFFSKWEHKAGGEEDTSLAGKHVEISGPPKSRSVKVLTPGSVTPDAATQWLQKEFAKSSEGEVDKIMTPKKPVAVGESWSPDVAALAKSMFSDGGPSVVQDKSKVTITLTGVEGDSLLLDFDFSMQTAELKSPQGTMAWTEGGLLTMKGQGRKPAKAESHSEGGKMTGGLKGKVDAGGMTVSFDMALAQDSDTKPGGEMPDVPKAE